ncbi:ABC-type iron(III) dicitrate-transport system component, TonB-dependent outer membrane receptor FecA precursor [Flavobacterium indicum GPTSA100-9 = DSM 17447]|uniref:ABC-type iron(III) dicitrate-transport system component, TonB-dependent outer membrane receptor FecA n=1 Tax=Flavobacterium indicum (strain DSM 17447 / CIP 109464 / GPTSA100-9) TaxID=1094466 RepID=H8XRR9_FLAIG|nr:TonB-dependent receptor [Flavobacterium indicum]CCG54503.1 ABC-type iron(III) dicitrate-transport system component, TonB-dependent outer membrane receptor FecA precursor [Flavobacterium indicum GPTSA100-9 = DSM 17447]
MKNILFGLLAFSSLISAQELPKDTVQNIPTVLIEKQIHTPERQPEVKNNIIYSGKKNEILKLENFTANVANNNAREIFSRVPGVTVWEYDGSGIQINVATRGLNPNRSWEFNTRQNGYDISSDVFGYPEAYYNPSFQAVEKIEIIRGGAALQYGPQFGGLLNYILKREKNKPFSFETQTTLGSYNLLSSYNAMGGTKGKFSYYIYNDSKKGDGWRNNARYDVRNTHAFIGYQFNKTTSLTAEYTNADYTAQQAGGILDADLSQNPRISYRARNWFGAPWNLANITLDTKLTERLTLNVKAFGLIGERNSVGFLGNINTPDPGTKRDVARDFYKNIGIETRSMFSYQLFNKEHNLAFGLRAYYASTNRKQNGVGTTGSDFDLSVENNTFNRDLEFTTTNYAFFAENIFRITDALSITPGIRIESIKNEMEGRLSVTSGNEVMATPTTSERTVILGGLGAQYNFGKTNLYSNITQAYRPVLFGDLTPPGTTDVVDSNLKDNNGYTFDLGYRGDFFNFITFDVSYFYMTYNNRIGTIRKFINDDPAQGTYQFRTNLGESVNKGFEGYAAVDIFKAIKLKNKGSFEIFGTLSFISAKYTENKVYTASGSSITVNDYSGNRVEYAPKYIHQFGVTYGYKNFTTTIQNKIMSDVYTNAKNDITPAVNANDGKIDKYTVYDWSFKFNFLEKYNLKGGMNNVFNTAYATRRAGGFPGPGLIPNEGRTVYISLGAKF